MKRIILVILTWLPPAALLGVSTKSLDSIEGRLNYFRDLPLDQYVSKLGPRLESFKTIEFFGGSERERRVLKKVQDVVTQVPGHAKVFADEIRSIDEGLLNEPGNDPHFKRTNYSRQIDWQFRALKFLPSHETVMEMTTFLPRMDPSVPADQVQYYRNLGFSAANVILRHIADPPTRDPYDRRVWLDWKRTVENGEQTFRLKGSPQHYTVDGPVDEPIQISRNHSPSSTNRHGPSGNKKSRETADPSTPEDQPSEKLRWIYGALALLLGFGGWMIFKNRKQT